MTRKLINKVDILFDKIKEDVVRELINNDLPGQINIEINHSQGGIGDVTIQSNSKKRIKL